VVTPNDMPLTVRSGPGTAYRKIDKGRDGRILGLACKKNGTKVLGDARWYKLAGHRGYVSAHYVRTFRPFPCLIGDGYRDSRIAGRNEPPATP
jgi:uncharacterized protein YraI